MSFNPITASTDYNTLTAEQIIAQKQKIAEESRKLDIVLKEKMEEQRAGFVQNVAEQVQALEIMPHDFISSFKSLMKMGEGSAYTAKEIFDIIPVTQLEQWFADFNKLKNEKIRTSKTPFFKLPKKTKTGISPDKFSTIYFEDIKGGDKGIQAIALKVGKDRKEAESRIFDTIAKDDPRINTVLDMFYPSKKSK